MMILTREVISSADIFDNREYNSYEECLANQEYAINRPCISKGYATEPQNCGIEKYN